MYKQKITVNKQSLKMSKKFTVYSSEQKVFDEQGRPRIQTTEKKINLKVDDEDKFYMVFLNCVSWMYGIKSMSTLKVLYKLLEYAEWESGKVSLSPGRRLDIMTELDIKKSSLTQAINQLIEVNALYPETTVDKSTGEIKTLRGEYTINPEMFWKGDLKKRKDLIITFQSDISQN